MRSLSLDANDESCADVQEAPNDSWMCSMIATVTEMRKRDRLDDVVLLETRGLPESSESLHREAEMQSETIQDDAASESIVNLEQHIEGSLQSARLLDDDDDVYHCRKGEERDGCAADHGDATPGDDSTRGRTRKSLALVNRANSNLDDVEIPKGRMQNDEMLKTNVRAKVEEEGRCAVSLLAMSLAKLDY